MDGFDTLTMSYMAATRMSHPNVTSQNTLGMLPLDNLDHHSNFDAETYAGSDEVNFGAGQQHTLQQQPQQQLQRFPTGFEDPFQDNLSSYDQSTQQEHGETDTPSIERDNKLLSFSPLKYHYNLLDYSFRRVTVSMAAQLHGMFFLAESPWSTAGDMAPAPTELTCYRRNLFQITGSITLPRTLNSVLTDAGEQIPIIGQELTISATESVEGNPVKIISVPWKTPASNQVAVEDKTEKEPPSIPLDLSQGHDVDSDFVNFPIAWKRLQFRIATANNGRRKELQQHFVVKLKLIGHMATGARIPLCEVHSGAIIVRGRSPRNFQSRKDLPISNSGPTIRRTSHNAASTSRTSAAGDSSQRGQAQTDRAESRTSMNTSQPTFSYDANDMQLNNEFFDWKVPNSGQVGAMTAVPDNFQVPGTGANAAYAQSTPDLSRNQRHNRPPLSAPISLSLTEDEPKKSASPAGDNRKAPRLTPVRPPSFSINLISSPDESADLLYEYFPLGLDDWMPPVDAVYRPHVVHHTNVPQDPNKAKSNKNRSKRYFSEDQPA